MSDYAKMLPPAKGSFFTRWWFIVIIVGAVVASLVGLALFGTIDLSPLASPPVLAGIIVAILAFLLGKLIYEGHFNDYYVELDYNSEIFLGKKRGEFSFSLEGKMFHGVDCGKYKIVLLQGVPSNHEKKLVTPSSARGRLFSVQSLKGQHLKRIILRGIPVPDVNTILHLGWIGIPDIDQQKDPTVVMNLKKFITSPEYANVIWLAPSVPDEYYKQFLFNERSLPEIEIAFEGQRDNMLREFSGRIDDLKSYYLHVGSEVFHELIEIIKITVGSYQVAAMLVTYMLGKHPSEVMDVMSALDLESKRDTLPNVMEKELRKFEEARDKIQRFAKVLGLPTEDVEAKVNALEQAISTLREKVPKPPTGKAETEAALATIAQ